VGGGNGDPFSCDKEISESENATPQTLNGRPVSVSPRKSTDGQYEEEMIKQ